MIKHWFLVALMVFGLLAVGLYASPPDPGGMVVSSTFANQISPDYLAGGAIERAAATISSATPWHVSAPSFAVTLLLAVALIGLLFVISVTPYVSSATRANTGNTSIPPERYDKAHSFAATLNSDALVNPLARRLAKRTKSNLLKRQSP